MTPMLIPNVGPGKELFSTLLDNQKNYNRLICKEFLAS